MRYVFGDYSLDNQRYELCRGGTLIPLGPQVFNVLAYLMAHRHRVVSRDELFERLWPEQFVTDDALGRCIRAARHALEDPPEAPRYISTVRGRGYRFIAPVQEQPHTPADDGVATPVPSQSMPLQPVSLATVLADAQSSPPSLALVGEYKQVTVLCGGLADASALAIRLGPEAMHRLMQTVFTAVQLVLQRYAGSLVEFSGDNFFTLFGAPVAQEDHAQRAVLAAFALHEQLGAGAPALRQAPGEPLAVCLGLHTGRVVIDRLGEDPPRLYTAPGETTRVALRLRQLAAPGTILLSVATQHLVQEDVWVEPQGEIEVGETHAPVPAYCARGIARRRSGVVGHGARARSPFVGRERELALLHERLDAVVARQGQVVALVGEPGMGKSRLLAEYRHSLVGRQVQYAEGHCLSYGSATPYLPVVELMRQLCGITAGEPRDASTAKVQQRLLEADIAPHADVPLLLYLLDIPVEMERLARLSPPERKARTFALLRHLVLHEAQRQPCIIVIENLHWIDPTSEEWLTSLVERLSGTAMLLLVTYRPGYQPLWLAQSYATQIALSPLRADDSRTVVQAVLQSAAISEALVQEILAKAAGNPFFLEELAWHVVEHGEQPAPLLVPETVEAVLAARIDRLPPEEKHLLQTAAVIGMHVTVPLLQAIADLSEAESLTRLNHLQTAEFLYETRVPPASAYTFKHALTQEVAYGSLLQEQRRALHVRIVEALETLAEDRLAEQVEHLAHHALRGEVWDKALMYCRQAGAKVGARSAYREAMAYLEQALAALQHLPERRDTLEQAIDLRLDLRAVLVPLGELGRILDCLREAEALAEALDDQLRLGQVSVYMAQYFWLMGDPERTVEFGERALTLASILGDFALQVNTNLFLGQGYRVLGDYRRALDAFRQNVVCLEGELLYTRFDLASYLPAVISRTWLAVCLAVCGEFTEGITRAEEGLRIAEAADPHSLIVALYGVGFVYLSKGDFYKAIPTLERDLALCQSWGFLSWFPPIAAALGSAYAAAGRVAEAIPLLEQAVRQAGARNRTDEVGLLANLSRAYLLADRMEEAMPLAWRALVLSREQKHRSSQAWALRLLGETDAYRGPRGTEQARTHYRQALALAEELGLRPLQAHCHFGLGTLYAKTGQAELAGAELAAAIGLYRAMDMTFWLLPAETVLAQIGG